MNALLFTAVWFLGLHLEACVEHLFPCRVVFLSQVSDLDSLLGVRHLILQPVDLLEPPCRLQLFYVGFVAFHCLVSLALKKVRLSSPLPCFSFTFSTSALALLALTLPLAISDQVLLF